MKHKQNATKAKHTKTFLIALLVTVLLVLGGLFIYDSWIIGAIDPEDDLLIFANNPTEYTIHYMDYSSSRAYYIYARQKDILVEKRNIVQCIQAPCDPIKSGEFTVTYKPAYREMFDTLFKDSESKEKLINADPTENREQLPSGTLTTIRAILAEEGR